MAFKRKPVRRRANGEGSIYPLANGRWRVAFTQHTPQGPVRIYRTRTSQALARVALDELRADAPAQSLLDPRRLNVAEYLDQWMSLHVSTLEVNTQVSYQTSVEKHIKPYIGRLALKKLAPLHIAQWLKDCEDAKVPPRARQAAFSTLRSAMNHAVSPLRLLTISPCQSIKAPKHTRRKIDPFDVSEIQVILAGTRGTRWHAFFAVAFGMGLRQGEMLGLHWSEVDFRTERITVKQQLIEAKGKSFLKGPKTTAGWRTVKIPKHVIHALRDHKAILMREGHAANPLVFPNTVGKFQAKANLHAGVWKPLLARLGFRQRGVHHCRHSFATLSLISGVDAATVANAMGHAHAGVTLAIYSHCLPSTESATADAMDRLFG